MESVVHMGLEGLWLMKCTSFLFLYQLPKPSPLVLAASRIQFCFLQSKNAVSVHKGMVIFLWVKILFSELV